MRARPVAAALQFLAIAILFTIALGIAACGGGGSGPSPAIITAHPADQTVTAGTTATFVVVASGATGYQWQRSDDGGATFSSVPGATAASHTTAVTTPADSGKQYRVVVTGAGNSVTSSAATLTVTADTPVSITTTSPLPAGTVNVAYSVQLAASGGTPPFTWTVSGGTMPAGLALDAPTGLISGTPTAAAAYGLTVQVSDSATPQQSDTRYFDIDVQAPCDVGLGSVTIAGAPSTVEGKLCPRASVAPGTPNASGIVYATWTETYPYGSGAYYEHLGVWFYAATGQVDSMSFNLHDPTRSIVWNCSSAAWAPPPCANVTVDLGLGTVTFVDSVLGENGTVNNPLTLNGVLRYR